MLDRQVQKIGSMKKTPEFIELLRRDGQSDQCWIATDGTRLRVRPIEPRDESSMIDFHRSLSDETVYSRYFSWPKLSTRILHERLSRICTPDPLDEVVLVAETVRPDALSPIVAVARLCHGASHRNAEAALLITDSFQRRGLGAELLRRLFRIARNLGAVNLVAYFMPSNAAMRHLCINEGMSITDEPGGESIANIALRSGALFSAVDVAAPPTLPRNELGTACRPKTHQN